MRGKIPAEEKEHLVREYLAGTISVGEIAHKHEVNRETVYGWVRRYNARGACGFVETGKARKYTPVQKRQAVEDYLSGAGSLSTICDKYDISDKRMLRRWILWYNEHGEFRQASNGRREVYMQKGRRTTLEERVEMVSHCIASNRDYGKTAETHGVSYQQIYTWVAKYEAQGVEGLIDRRGQRKEEASMTEVEKLRAQLKLQQAKNDRLQMENDLLKKLEEVERGRGQV